MSRPGGRCLPALDALAHAVAARALQAVQDDMAQAAKQAVQTGQTGSLPPEKADFAPSSRPAQASRTPDTAGTCRAGETHDANEAADAARPHHASGAKTPLWALDATAGNGHDSLFLARSLSAFAHGRLLAVDIQPQALERTAARLTQAGFVCQRLDQPESDNPCSEASPSPAALTAWPPSTGRIETPSPAARATPSSAREVTGPASSTTLTECRPSVTVSAPVLLLQADHATLGPVLDTLALGGRLAVALFNLGFLPGSDKRRVTTAAGTLAALEAVEKALAPGGLISLHLYTGHPGGEDEAEAVLEHAARLPRTDWRVLRLSQHNKPRAAEHLLLLEQIKWI